MPIEIKELHIRVTVNPSSGGRQTGAQGGAGVGAAADADDERGRNQMVAECVEQVLGILESKRER
ncbi:MAG: DUF5908 family protein [Nitrospira sp.]|nr:DUF5908 family protein [Nitrospira sp.]